MIATTVISISIKILSKLVDVCVAISMLKMKEKKATLWCIMLYYFKKSKNTTATHTHIQICVVYGEVSLTDQTCQKWLAKSHAVDFSLDDAPQLNRAVAVFAVQSLNDVQLFATSRIAACQASLKAMAPHSSTLAWKIPWTEEPGRQSMGLRKVRHD